MVSVKIAIGQKLWTIEILNTLRRPPRNSSQVVYSVKYRAARGMNAEFTVNHNPEDGLEILLAKVMQKIAKRAEKFYTVPEHLVRDGMIKFSDIPKQWSKQFGKWLGVATCGELDGELAALMGDVNRYLRYVRTGVVPMWD